MGGDTEAKYYIHLWYFWKEDIAVLVILLNLALDIYERLVERIIKQLIRSKAH